MSEHKQDRTDKELFDAMNQLFSEVEPGTPEEIDEVIKAIGYDPESFAARMKAVARRSASESPLNWRNKARTELELERKRLESRTATRRGVGEELRTRIQDLLTQLGSKPNVAMAFAHHRNLDTASDEDLASLLEELEHLIGDNSKLDDE